MKKVLVVSTVLAVALLTAAFPAPAGAQSFDEEVKTMVGMVVEAWNGGDAERLASMFTQDADLREENGRWLTGPEEIYGYFREWMAGSDGAKEVLVERSRRVTEQAAVVDVISGVVPKGGTFWGEETTRFTITVDVVKQQDGSWLFTSWRQCHSTR